MAPEKRHQNEIVTARRKLNDRLLMIEERHARMVRAGKPDQEWFEHCVRAAHHAHDKRVAAANRRLAERKEL